MLHQHFVMITGGLIGTEWKIWHLKASQMILFNPGGKVVFAFSAIISHIVSLIALISSVSDCNVLSSQLFFAHVIVSEK